MAKPKVYVYGEAFRMAFPDVPANDSLLSVFQNVSLTRGHMIVKREHYPPDTPLANMMFFYLPESDFKLVFTPEAKKSAIRLHIQHLEDNQRMKTAFRDEYRYKLEKLRTEVKKLEDMDIAFNKEINEVKQDIDTWRKQLKN
jgi:septal ring factor EnvC (AmiA/AmiB activator)